MTKVFSAKCIQSRSMLNTIKQMLSLIPKVFRAKLVQSTLNLIKVFKLSTLMKTIRTPETNYFEFGEVEFSTSRKDGELYYEIFKWNESKTDRIRIDFGKVKDEVHLKELQEIEN